MFLPGFIASSLLIYIAIPSLEFFNINSSLLNELINLGILEKLLVIAVVGILLGMIIQLSDLYIYQFLEGIRFWPPLIWNKHLLLSVSEYENIFKDIEKLEELKLSTNDQQGRVALNNEISRCAGKLRRYPVNRAKIEATNLGNILAEYESYPEEQYGMSFNIYWNRLLLVLPEETKNELDIRGARGDFPVYTTFIFVFFIPIVLIRSLQLWGIFPGLFAVAGWLIITNILYKLALESQVSFGGYVKAIFDIHRIDLANKLGLPVYLCPNEEEKAIWRDYKLYLEEYAKPDYLILQRQIK